jgi:hypothetical protein
VLQGLLPHAEAYKEQFERLAARIAVNRTVAGLHFPVDSAVGRLAGTFLGEFFIGRCTGAQAAQRGFDGPQFHCANGEAIDFDPRVSMSDGRSGYYEIGESVPVPQSELLQFMWDKAAAEWKKA